MNTIIGAARICRRAGRILPLPYDEEGRFTVNITTFTRESAVNRQAYDRLRSDIRRDHAGKYVALANGRLIGAAPTFDEAQALVKRLRPVPEYYLVFPADIEPDFELAYDLAGSV
jgi:hypothetical protein